MKRYVFIIFLILSSVNFAQRKGLWVIRDQLTSTQKIDSLIQFAEDNKITDLFVQVRGRGRVLYNSSFESMEYEDLGFDPLAYILRKSSGSRLRIHAWVNIFLIWSQENPPPEEKHPFNRFRKFILKDFENHSFDEIYHKMIRSRKLEGYYLSPASPEVQDYLTDILKEICLKYQVDGIHLDYFRYPKNNFIFDPAFLNYLSNKYHYAIDELNSSGAPVSVEKSRQIAYLLSRPLTDFLINYHNWLAEYFPQVELSVAVKSDPDVAFLSYYQNWEEWINQNMVDFVCPMLYTNRNSEFLKILSKIDALEEKEKIWIGLGAFNKDEWLLRKQMQEIYNRNYKNFLYFSYKYVKKLYEN